MVDFLHFIAAISNILTFFRVSDHLRACSQHVNKNRSAQGMMVERDPSMP